MTDDLSKKDVEKVVESVVQDLQKEAEAQAAAQPGSPLPELENPTQHPEVPTSIEKDPNADNSMESRIIEIWYDRRNWNRYVRTRHFTDTPEGRKPFDIYALASCVEMSQLNRISEQVYERNKQYAKDGHCLAIVVNPGSPKSTLAENDLLLLMQAAYDEEPMAQGNKTIAIPSKWDSCLKEKI